MKGLDRLFNDREQVSKVSVLELRKLLVLLSENPNEVCFRYRLIGQMWQPNFVRVMEVTETGVLVKHDLQNKTTLISDLKWIIQFELDGSMHAFAPNFHYDVVPD